MQLTGFVPLKQPSLLIGYFNLFNIISRQGNAFSPSLFELSYLFKIRGLFLVPQVLVYWLYDTLIASPPCATKMGFLFWEQIEVWRSHIRRIWGMRKDFLWFPGVAALIRLHNMHVYCATLLKIISHDHTLTIPKDWGHYLPCWMKPLTFDRRVGRLFLGQNDEHSSYKNEDLLI